MAAGRISQKRKRKSLDFAQTKGFGGYEIRAGVLLSRIKNSPTINLERLTDPRRIVTFYIFSALNSSTNFYVKQFVIMLDMIDSCDTDIIFWSAWPREKDTISLLIPTGVWKWHLSCSIVVNYPKLKNLFVLSIIPYDTPLLLSAELLSFSLNSFSNIL